MGLPWKRFVALGDSVTEGVGDPQPDGKLRGWADRLAEALSAADGDVEYTNLARRGLKTEEVREQQLPAALELRPDLASALVGMNDLLEPNFDPSSFEQGLTSLVGPLRDAGAVVLMATLPDVTMFSPLPARLTAGIRKRLGDACQVVRRVAGAHGALLLDVDDFPEAKERHIISVDRLHPGPRGHVLLAQTFAHLLEEHSGVPIPQPEEGDVAGKLAQARWLIRQFKPAEVARFVYRFYLAPRRRTST